MKAGTDVDFELVRLPYVISLDAQRPGRLDTDIAVSRISVHVREER